MLGVASEEITAVAQGVVNPFTLSRFENIELSSLLSQVSCLVYSQ